MRQPILLVKNFYDDYTKKELNKWTLLNYGDSKIFQDAHNNPPGTSYTTRYTENIKFPDVAYKLQEKIIKTLNFTEYKLRYGHGIINTVNYPGCIVWEHKDSLVLDNYVIYHCNIVTKKPVGGETVIEGIEYDLEENDLICYAVDRLSHKVNLITGTKLRIMWIFGFHIPETEFYFDK